MFAEVKFVKFWRRDFINKIKLLEYRLDSLADYLDTHLFDNLEEYSYNNLINYKSKYVRCLVEINTLHNKYHSYFIYIFSHKKRSRNHPSYARAQDRLSFIFKKINDEIKNRSDMIF